MDVLKRQLAGSVPDGATSANLVIAYEPVWAIGTGLTPSEGDIAEAHAHIRLRLAERIDAEAALTRVLYGGSVKPSNAAAILGLDDVDGALVGGASLKAADFLAIVAAAK
jgi:triosephosphate isomerase